MSSPDFEMTDVQEDLDMGRLDQIRDFQRETLSSLDEIQMSGKSGSPETQGLSERAVLGCWERLNQELDRPGAWTHAPDQESGPFELPAPLWNSVPADVEPGSSNRLFADLESEDIPMRRDVSVMSLGKGGCGDPQCYCTLFEQPTGQFYPSASGPFLEPTTFEQGKPFDTQAVLSPCELTSSFGLTSGDPFFQNFRQLAAELGPCPSGVSRFFPTQSNDEDYATASSSQSAGEYSEYLDALSEFALSDAGDE
ncbi:hypothetical protein DHEL01_v210834 [Diaporthe helianthi]|uniref:Uncharacterized protein n=1 Tax=Diaporthe helianthi TaxID=158607 RepID=A0A2P5HKL9_DIAHE|nr:hypothetical protein DHEL01_v210834 [Diaporthe helianthi]